MRENHRAFRLSKKNTIYLSELGIINKKTHTTNRTANLSRFLNQCVSIVCELGILPDSDRLIPTPHDLQRSMTMIEIHQDKEQIRELQAQIHAKIVSLELFHTDSPKPLDSLLLSEPSTAILSEE